MNFDPDTEIIIQKEEVNMAANFRRDSIAGKILMAR